MDKVVLSSFLCFFVRCLLFSVEVYVHSLSSSKREPDRLKDVLQRRTKGKQKGGKRKRKTRVDEHEKDPSIEAQICIF